MLTIITVMGCLWIKKGNNSNEPQSILPKSKIKMARGNQAEKRRALSYNPGVTGMIGLPIVLNGRLSRLKGPNQILTQWFFRSLSVKILVIPRVLGLGAFFRLVTYLLPMVGRERIVRNII